MIPTFPEFKKIEITDQQEIEDFTKDYPPYSDFNFISLFCWDVDGKRRISMLNGNFVVRSTCDVSGKEFLSFLGTNKVPETIHELFQYAKREGLKQELRMIPEETAKLCPNPVFEVKEDRDSFDYVYLAQDLCELKGPRYASLRNALNKFAKKNGNTSNVKIVQLHNNEQLESMRLIWQQWSEIKETYSEKEERAMRIYFDNAFKFNCLNLMIFIDNHPVAFSISQMVHDQCAIAHFAKVDYSYPSVFTYLWNKTFCELADNGCVYVNLEEDLGIPGIRRAKELYRPTKFLKKFTISYGEKRAIRRLVSMLGFTM